MNRKITVINLRSYLFLFILLAGIVATMNLFAQKNGNLTIRGHVKDAKGEAVIGATVIQKGTTNGVTTDFDGNFTLSVPANSTLAISYIGYISKEINAGSQTNLNITMDEDRKVLDEVVIIGYGTVKKNDATGAIGTVKADQLNKGAISTPSDLLRGKSAGVVITSGSGQPGAGATIRIRGGSSLSATNDPLLVVDGLPISNSSISGVSDQLSSINPSDIESFTVLKDASATAIYGSRASNGVIIITTKKGSKYDSGKPKFNVDFMSSLSQNTKFVDVMDANQIRQAMIDYAGESSSGYAALGSSNTDWQKEIYQTAQAYDANISVGGNFKFGQKTKLPYRVSYGYMDQAGVLKTSSMKRSTASLNLSPTFFDDHLNVNINAKAMYIKNRFANSSAIGAAVAYDPTQAVYDDTTTGLNGYRVWRGSDGELNTMATMNPVALLNERVDKSTAKRMVGNVQLDYKFHGFEDLHYNFNLGLDVSSSDGNIDTPEGSEQSYHSTAESGSGYHGTYGQLKRDQTLETYLSYSKSLSKHNFDILGGYSWQHFYTSDWSTAVKQSDWTVELTGSAYHPTEYFLVSFFGRSNYSFDNRYLTTFTIRRDGTSRFTKNHWGLFPSAAFGWNITNEKFMQDNSLLSNLKLRLSWGQTGQQDLNAGNYPSLATYTTNTLGSYYYFGDELIVPITPNGYNANLKWETTTTYNAGIDFGFLKGRITGALDVYKRKTRDLINYIAIPALSNLTNYLTTNVGNLENTGLEFELNTIPLELKDWNWTLGANVALNKNKITKLTTSTAEDYIGVETGSISGGTGNTIQINQVEKPTNSFYVYEQVYDTAGNPIEGAYVDRNGDGTITSDDKYVYHKAAPDVTLGFNTSLTWKALTLAIASHANLGNWVYDNMASNYELLSDLWTNNFVSNRLVSASKTNFSSQAQYFSDYYVRNASFLKIDNITLNYKFDNLSALKRLGLGVNVYATAQNVYTFTKYKGIDPEIYSGIDNNMYPRPRTFVMGLKINF
ncbi:MAG: outer membrane protein involved in nutrient binding [Bacteroidetes bacterium]|nr:outer membrane protein involved in nutrient binding [Bacteroidota bacterium]